MSASSNFYFYIVFWLNCNFYIFNKLMYHSVNLAGGRHMRRSKTIALIKLKKKKKTCKRNKAVISIYLSPSFCSFHRLKET